MPDTTIVYMAFAGIFLLFLETRYRWARSFTPDYLIRLANRWGSTIQSITRTATSAIPTSLIWLGLLGLLAATTAASLRTATISTTVELPIEVFSPDGASPHIESITVSISDPAGIDSMYIQGHQLDYHKSEYADQNGYDTKASYRVNSGPWVPISNVTATCRYPEAEYECIGGPYNTLRLRVDATQSGAWQSGPNLIEFRFNGTEGISSGYRILDLDVLASSFSRIGATTFTQADPDTWTPATTDPADLAEGRDLFQQRNLLTEGPDGPDLIASCADCHARDGRDLWYYNFSNRSIEARSRFHGLSQTEAEKISSWIRTLHTGSEAEHFDLPTGVTVGDLGRPWNPPYQPGPSIDDRPVELWAAGAGLEWVLDNDADTKQHLFPDGLNSESAKSIASTETTMNVREIPIAVPLPDISEWWPDYHPFDVYGESEILNSSMWSAYEDIQSLDDPAVRDSEIQAAANGTRRFSGILSYFDDFHQGGNNYTMEPRFANNLDLELQGRHAFQQWQLMKTWEAMTRNDLEDIAPQILPGRTDEIRDDRSVVPGGEKYQWFHQNQIIWWAAPHMSARPDFPGMSPYPTPAQNQFFSHTWYQLQMTLNAGTRWPNGNKPMDWKYHFDLLSEASAAYGVPAGWRYFQGYLKMIEMYDTGKPISGSSWFIRHIHPRWMFRTGKGRQAMWDAMGPDYLDVLELSTEAFVNGSSFWADSTPDSDPYGADAWPRGTSGNLWIDEVESKSYVPSFTDGYHHTCCRANGFYKMADDLTARGADPAVVDDLAQWGNAMWPEGNWSQWFAATGQQEISLRHGWNLVSANITPESPSMESVFEGLNSDVVLVKDEQGESYVPAYGANSIGSWEVAEAYKVYSTAPRTLTITGAATSGNSSIYLNAGWNYVSYWPEEPMPAEDAFASLGSDLVVVRDLNGNEYRPGDDINTLHDGTGEVRPGHGYQVYVLNDAELTYPDGDN